MSKVKMEISGINAGDRFIPYMCRTTVGQATIEVLPDDIDLPDKLRCALAAVRLANASGIADIDIQKIVDTAASEDQASTEAISGAFLVWRPDDGERTRNAAAIFIDSIPDEPSGSCSSLCPEKPTSLLPRTEDECRQSACQDEE